MLKNLRLVHAPADPAHPVHVVIKGGATSGALTRAHQALRQSEQSADWVRKQVKGVFEFFDWLFEPKRCIDPTSSPATIMGALKAYLRSLSFTASRQAPYHWILVEGPRERKDAVGALLVGLRNAYTELVNTGDYPFEHPFELTLDQMREQRRRVVRSGRGKRRQSTLCDALFRLAPKSYAPPRRTQVELIRNVIAWAVEARWPESLVLYLRILVAGGCRPSDPSGFTLLDYYVGSRCGNGIKSSDKNDPAGRDKTVMFEDAEREDLHAYIDGSRYDATPAGEGLKVADILRLGDAGDFERLKQPLLLGPGGRAWKYNTISRNWWRPLMVSRCIDPVTGRPPMRLPTLHWLRHLFVFDMLALIELSGADEATKLRMKENLVAYIGWRTKLKMLATYGKEFEDRKVAKHMIAMMSRRSRMILQIGSGEGHWAEPRQEARKPSSSLSRMLRDRGDRVAA